MTEDPLVAAWTLSPDSTDREQLRDVAAAVIAYDRSARARERKQRILALLVLVIICPVLFWCAAYGSAPLVRAGFALMGAGTAVVIFAEWLYFSSAGAALPRGADTRMHLWQNASVLERQGRLMRTSPLWCAPVFIGAALLIVWMHQARIAQAWVLGVAVAAAWVTCSGVCRSQGRRLEERQQRLEQLLLQLQ